MSRSDTVQHGSMAELFRFILNKFNGEEALEGEGSHHFRIPVINQWSMMGGGHVCHSLVPCGIRRQAIAY